MKRLLATLLVILCLSFPVSAGHVLGTGRYCPCDGTNHDTMGLRVQSDEVENDCHQESTPDVDLGLLVVAVLLVLKFRA